jgi:hypothetical protein
MARTGPAANQLVRRGRCANTHRYAPSVRCCAVAQALKDSAVLAGLNVLALVNSHSAAALQFGIERDFAAKEQKVRPRARARECTGTWACGWAVGAQRPRLRKLSGSEQQWLDKGRHEAGRAWGPGGCGGRLIFWTVGWGLSQGRDMGEAGRCATGVQEPWAAPRAVPLRRNSRNGVRRWWWCRRPHHKARPWGTSNNAAPHLSSKLSWSRLATQQP